MRSRFLTEDDLKHFQRNGARVRGDVVGHTSLRGAYDGPVPNETGNLVRTPAMARNKDTAPVALRGESRESLDQAGRGQAYSPEAGHAEQLRSKESARRPMAGSNPAPSHSRRYEYQGQVYKSKTEVRYAQYLDALKFAGGIIDWQYEPVNFRLPGMKNYYKPDFLVRDTIRLTFYDTKGFNKSDERSLVKIKTAAGLNRWATFKQIRWIKGAWITRVIEVN